MAITHAKTDSITDWTQADLDAQIALGNFPAGTLLANIVLPSDWNAAHTIANATITNAMLVNGAVANLSGANTGDQTITLTGDVSGSGTGSFSATVAKIAGTTVSGTTGTGNVAFSASPTFTGTITAATITASGNITAPNLLTPIGFTSSDSTAVATGKVNGYFTCPYAGTITAFDFMVDAGTATVEVWKIATGTAVPTVANTINTSGVAISTGTALHSTTLSDFTTTTIAANDIFAFNIKTISGVKQISFAIQVKKT